MIKSAEPTYIRDEKHIAQNTTVTFADNSRSYLLKTGNLVVDAGAILVIEENVLIKGDSDLNVIDVYGEVVVNGNVDFAAEVNIHDGAIIRLNNSPNIEGYVHVLRNGTLIIGDNATFNSNSSLIVDHNASISGNQNANRLTISGSISFGNNAVISGLTLNNYGGLFYSGTSDLNIDKVTFIHSNLVSELDNSSVNISNCMFDNSAVDCKMQTTNGSVSCVFTSNTFKQIDGEAALNVEGYQMFEINDNLIYSNNGHGISLYNAGNSSYPMHKVHGNTIYGNNNSSNAKGILVYNTVADIYNNHIYLNDHGIGLYHNSNSSVRDIRSQLPNGIDQEIYDNHVYEVYAQDNSFPAVFEWNIIQDADDRDEVIYCIDFTPQIYDVQNNCWGNSFDPHDDLYPFQDFRGYEHPWDCGVEVGNPQLKEPRIRYEAGIANLQSGNTAGAENQFKSIVETYPDDRFAEAAIKALPSVAIANNYNGIINYLANSDDIQSRENLQKLAGYTIAKCNIMAKNYGEALGFYESVISNPPTYADSVYAVIDAGRVALMMEEEGKSGYSFKYPALVPESDEAYQKNRDYLLSTIKPVTGIVHTQNEAGQEQSTTGFMENATAGNQLSIYPNPFTQQTTISYTTQWPDKTEIKLFNATGQTVKIFQSGVQPAGQHSTTINAKGLPHGIYYITVKQDGEKPLTGKLIVIK